MPKTAFIFPGQGSQSVGMGKDLYETHPTARQILDQADEVLGINLTQLCFSGPREELDLTINTQPAILAVSYALFKLLNEKGIVPLMVAGHSLGEYSALLSVGSIAYPEALKLVRRRAELMQEACAPGVGAMAALVGVERTTVVEICQNCSSAEVVEAVNFNCPGQIVIAGHKEAVQKAMDMAKAKGVKLVTMLPVSIPSHCSLMQEAGGKLKAYLETLNFRQPRIPLVTNVNAQVATKVEDLQDALVKQLSSPVYWEDSIQTMIKLGIDTFVEVGPGTVLSKLLKRIDRQVTAETAGDLLAG
ncbi:MAG: ACP S-malonyltransferase [Candidatus Schekmanbacteria bacterium]|nr:ACP S-malonyltransferase [Candidatus Schekmanbacteria bacterium]